MRPRLAPATLAQAAAGVQRPGFDRTRLATGIVHLGVGAFHRAHQAVVNDAAIAAAGDLRWGICGASLRAPDTHDALAPQGGLYTVALRDAGGERLQVTGSLTALAVAPTAPGALLEHIAAPDTRLVTLTVTEKGYHHDPATGRLRDGDEALAQDLAQPGTPQTALGFLVHGLALRRHRGLGPLTLLSCDNLPANGQVLGRLVQAFASRVDPALADWIADGCRFPSCMVDRIVPRTTDVDRERISAALGLDDAWPVLGEPFLDWVIEDGFAAGRPAWEAGGARFVADVAPFEFAKLRMLNGPHSTLAYLGAMAGLATVDEAVAQPWLLGFVDALMRDEIAPTLPAGGPEPDGYRRRILARFANPALQHRLRQIAMDGSQKLPQRLLGTVRDRLRAGAGIERLALAVAGWLHYLRGSDEAGRAFTIDDPLAAALAAARAEGGTAGPLALAAVFGDLGAEPAFAAPVRRWFARLEAEGVEATVRAALAP